MQRVTVVGWICEFEVSIVGIDEILCDCQANLSEMSSLSSSHLPILPICSCFFQWVSNCNSFSTSLPFLSVIKDERLDGCASIKNVGLAQKTELSQTVFLCLSFVVGERHEKILCGNQVFLEPKKFGKSRIPNSRPLSKFFLFPTRFSI